MKFMSIKQISVLGGGSWGTILSNLSCKQGIETLLWMRDKNIAQEINTQKENNNYLPVYDLGNKIKFSPRTLSSPKLSFQFSPIFSPQRKLTRFGWSIKGFLFC